MADVSLTELAQRGEFSALEDRWLSALEDTEDKGEEMLNTLEILNKNEQSERATELAWTWLTEEKERNEPQEFLDLAREVILRCEDNQEMREEIIRLYREVYADRPELEQLLEISGLAGGKSPRRALRTLEICLNLQEGDYLVSRSEEEATRVTAIDRELCEYTITVEGLEETFDADRLALRYDPVEPTDFRVLMQLHPERVPELLESNPVELVIGILKSHHDRIDTDQLEELLSPRFVESKRWSNWWNKARAELRKSTHVILEGRNPVMLTYHAAGQTLEDEILPEWEKAESTRDRLNVVETYLREAKVRKATVKKKMIERMYDELAKRVKTSRPNAPAHALAEALVIDRIAEAKKLHGDQKSQAAEIVAENEDPITLLREISDFPRFDRVLELVKENRPNDWPEVYAEFLPLAPATSCDYIAESLLEADRQEQLVAAMNRIPENFTRHISALCWYWRGPKNEQLDQLPGLNLPTRRELLPQILDHLAELNRNEQTPPDVLREARTQIRAALASDNYSHFRDIIEEMGDNLAFTVYRSIERVDGLGQVVHNDLLNIIREMYPHLFVQKKLFDPWTAENVVYTSQQGLRKHQEELNHLLNVKIPENAKAIGEAAAHGDLSENSEYKFALEERDLLQSRARAMQEELSKAQVMTADNISTDRVNIGTTVHLVSTDGDSRKQVTILGPWDTDIDRGIYNYKAPLCMKLRNLRPGDTINLDLDDSEKEYRIESISNALE